MERWYRRTGSNATRDPDPECVQAFCYSIRRPRRTTQFSLTAIPFLASSSIASRDLWRSPQPIPSRTALCLVNWIFAYSTICTRFPHGSLNSTPLPGKSLTPAFELPSDLLFIVHHEAKVV